jgi:hypothetical protein
MTAGYAEWKAGWDKEPADDPQLIETSLLKGTKP